AVLSLKGGVGKTTAALGLAGAAVEHGMRSLLVDLDPQANATASTQPGPTRATIADVLDQPRHLTASAAVSLSEWGEDLHVLVGSEDTERHNHPDPAPNQLIQLDQALGQLDQEAHDGSRPYALAIVDCPPSLGRLTRSALAAADLALLVAEPTIFAVSGVQ